MLSDCFGAARAGRLGVSTAWSSSESSITMISSGAGLVFFTATVRLGVMDESLGRFAAEAVPWLAKKLCSVDAGGVSFLFLAIAIEPEAEHIAAR